MHFMHTIILTVKKTKYVIKLIKNSLNSSEIPKSNKSYFFRTVDCPVQWKKVHLMLRFVQIRSMNIQRFNPTVLFRASIWNINLTENKSVWSKISLCKFIKIGHWTLQIGQFR